jgi:uncharacterized membrane protein
VTMSDFNRYILWACVLGLLILFTSKTLILPPGGKQPNFVIWLFHCIPLACCIPGLLRRLRRAYIGLCFILLLYFVMAGGTLFAEQTSFYDTATLILVAIAYVSGLLAARWLREEQPLGD